MPLPVLTKLLSKVKLPGWRNPTRTATLGYYEHLPLRLSLREIRLLLILPVSHESALECKLLRHELAETLDYEALSYCWGDSDGGQRRILVNSQEISVGANLESALRHLRHESETRCLWADAICINQDDLDERSAQVLLMRDIYVFASGVIVWLGEGSENSVAAAHIIRGFKENNYLDTDVVGNNSHKFGSIFHREWWWRAWVVQEIALML